jgi:anthranilate/para-aminobenzoate synthase component I
VPTARPQPSRPADAPAWAGSPADLLRAWPPDRPLAAAALGDGRWLFAEPDRVLRPGADGLRAALAGLDPDERWIGWLDYEAGSAFEPTAARAGPPAGPVATLLRVGAALVGADDGAPWRAEGAAAPIPAGGAPGSFELAGLESLTGPARYAAAVERAVEYVHAGDVFQVNLSHTIEGAFRGSARAWAATLIERAAPTHGGYVESFDERGGLVRAVCSISPESLVRVDGASRRVVTRPIKGTRPGDGRRGELLASEKDAAELAMIVDLMRNDLGRVCELGSVRVDDPRAIELHGAEGAGVLHGVATVSGRLRAGVGHAGLVEAVFPAGSITGAPKVRAMQIIEALEERPRGAYCGSLALLGPGGDARLNVAIRTATLECDPGSSPTEASGRVRFPVGAGVVADSDPMAEWNETLAKAATFLGAVARGPA